MGEKRMGVFCVFGTRPEAIKLAPVIQQLSQQIYCKNDTLSRPVL